MGRPTVLHRDFFLRDVKRVAPELLGKILCVRDGEGTRRAIISETEAYDGEKDMACHASKGKTNRNSIMYAEGGICYVYLCYGLHWMLNLVTGQPGYPAAVLIRGSLEVTGPGRLSKVLGINRSFNGMDLSRISCIWVEDNGRVPKEIHSGPRIGVDYAGPVWSMKPYRFWFSNY